MLSPKETARSACEHFSFHIINSEVHAASMFELAGVPLYSTPHAVHKIGYSSRFDKRVLKIDAVAMEQHS